MVVILIIGLLMTISVTAVTRALTSGRQTAMKLEISALSQAVERYMQKYGDYPPDGSSREVLDRHMRRLFPRMASPDTVLFNTLTATPVSMDRAEALVFFIGGFSEDPLHPLTGEGGPLALVNEANRGSTDMTHYQYNATRDNAFFDFDLARLTVARASDNARLLSTDETLLGYNDAAHGGNDLLPVYLARAGDPTPIIYFDSRTYGLIDKATGLYNGFLTPNYGGIRPYKSGLNVEPAKDGSGYASQAEAFAAVPFHNPNTFQIISPGLDGIYGAVVSINPENVDDDPVHFITETGTPVTPRTSVSGLTALIFTGIPGHPVGPRFQDVDWLPNISVNGHLDNITNFSESTLENGLQ